MTMAAVIQLSALTTTLFVFTLSLQVDLTRAQNANIEQYDQAVTKLELRCYYSYSVQCRSWAQYTYFRCYRRWNVQTRTSCSSVGSLCCYYASVVRYEKRERCKLNQWKNYPKCDVPICTPECSSTQMCISPNQCGCHGKPNEQCKNVACKEPKERNCYPGTCDASGRNCKCPSGFTGDNCQNMELTPVIQICNAQISAVDGKFVGSATECAAEGLTPNEWPTNWIGRSALQNNTDGVLRLRSVQASWDVEYTQRVNMPDRTAAPFITNSPVNIGISESTYTISLPNSGLTSKPIPCTTGPIRYGHLSNSERCLNKEVDWSILGISGLIRHNTTMQLQFSAKLGGQKTGDFIEQTFTGNVTSRNILFKFDFEPPTHCAFVLKKGGADLDPNCTTFPIALNESITSNPKIQPTFSDWTDDGSGIDRYEIDVYYLQKGAQDELEYVGGPEKHERIWGDQNYIIFDCKRSGTYAIELSVYDRANNVAKARKIFTYNAQSSISQMKDKPFYLERANPNTNYSFISTAIHSQGDYQQFTARWPGHFESTFKSAWSGGVKRWPASEKHWLDDEYADRFGVRSTDAITNQTAIQFYHFAFAVDTMGGIGAQIPPFENLSLISDTSKPEHTFSVRKDQLQNGNTIVMWLIAYDVDANLYNATSKVSLHTSRHDMNITKGPDSVFHHTDPYLTGVTMNFNSSIGGIKNITYQLFDKTLSGAEITEKLTAGISRRDSRVLQSSANGGLVNLCNPDDNNCYCIPLGYCYEVTQVILIDNCLFDKHAGHDIEIKFEIFALSEHAISSSVTLKEVSLHNIPCRPIAWSTGGIVALIIFIIILIVLLIILALMFVRWRQHKHPIPQRFRSAMTSIRNRVNYNTENELYGSAPDPRDDVKSHDGMKYKNNVNKAKLLEEKNDANEYSSGPQVKHMEEATRNEQKLKGAPEKKISGKVVTSKNLQVGQETLGEGRFAIVRKAQWQQGNKTVTVAVKALRSGYSKSDVNIMNEKIQFMSKLPQHVNIVNYLGTYQEDGTGAALAPAMLLDICDTPLTEWLASTKNIYDKYQNPEILENMLNFSLNIARGMEHLHSSRIIHKRLSAKNVLLVNTVNGIIAKLIGFGPTKGDGPDQESQSNNPAVVKVKWLAPETLASLKLKNPVYDEKTDTWSYGVTMWEIYSKGDPPYEDLKSSDVHNQLKSGYKLSCPKDCAFDLYNGVMLPCWNLKSNQRPNFETICSFIEKYRRGEDTQGQGYYGTDDLAEGDQPPQGYYAADDLEKGSKNRHVQELYDDAR